MINNLGLNDLMELSNQQSTMIEQIETLINGLDDPLYTIAAPILTGWEGTPMTEILDNFKNFRNNALAIFEIVQAEIKKRLDESPSHRLLEGKAGHTVTLMNDGTITYTKVKKYDGGSCLFKTA